MSLLFNGAVAGNGFNSLGHYLRAEPLVSSCTSYATIPVAGCSSNFEADAASVPPGLERIAVKAVRRAPKRSLSTTVLKSLLGYLVADHK
jgi:hypothetical protein